MGQKKPNAWGLYDMYEMYGNGAAIGTGIIQRKGKQIPRVLLPVRPEFLVVAAGPSTRGTAGLPSVTTARPQEWAKFWASAS